MSYAHNKKRKLIRRAKRTINDKLDRTKFYAEYQKLKEEK